VSGLDAGLKAHLETGVTTTCRAWALSRRDGVVMGFTDHDAPLSFEGITFRADTGMSALALQQSTGLSVDNTEALGALSDAAIREEDIEAGRYDGAEVRAWLVNWADVEQRHLQFRGTIGELRRAGGAFQAELRGLTDLLNVPMGRVYQAPCSAVLGDAACGLDLTAGWTVETVLAEGDDRRVLRCEGLEGQAPGWFRHGVVKMMGGQAQGLSGLIKEDRLESGLRVIELWHPLRAAVAAGDALRLTAGCDKRSDTCRVKFANLLNFQGFPDIPGDDWSISDPMRAGSLNGGSRRA
jgi:uncharacterized phage protein (TIGR02218 family)